MLVDGWDAGGRVGCWRTGEMPVDGEMLLDSGEAGGQVGCWRTGQRAQPPFPQGRRVKADPAEAGTH